MAQKMTGALVFDERTDRYDIRFDLASYYGGLHCGDCFDVFTRGKWKPTRIEMNMKQEWYLVGIRLQEPRQCGPPPIREQMAQAAKEAGKENASRPALAKKKEARDDR